MAMATMSAASHFAITNDHEDSLSIDTSQSIPGHNIDSSKLLSLLRMKFGVGSYDMHVSRNQ
jgi:hypothetical protein